MTRRYGQHVLAPIGAAVISLPLVGALLDGVGSRVRLTASSLLAGVAERAGAAAFRYGGPAAAGALPTIGPLARELAHDEVRDGARDGLVVLSDEGVVADCTHAAADVLGDDREALVTEPLAAHAPDVADAVGTALDSSEDTQPAGGIGTPANAPPSVTRMTEKGWRHYEVRASRVSQWGRNWRIVVLRDVTRCHRLRRRIGVLNRLLRHDLRNEMNVVVGYAELLETDQDASDFEAGDLDAGLHSGNRRGKRIRGG